MPIHTPLASETLQSKTQIPNQLYPFLAVREALVKALNPSEPHMPSTKQG